MAPAVPAALKTAIEKEMGPHMAVGRKLEPGIVDESIPAGMTLVRRVTQEEVRSEAPQITENSTALESATGILKADDPKGNPGRFRLKKGTEERLLVVVEPEIRNGQGRRTRKQVTAFFDRLPGSKDGLTYAYKNPVHCANLRMNPHIEEVF